MLSAVQETMHYPNLSGIYKLKRQLSLGVAGYVHFSQGFFFHNISKMHIFTLIKFNKSKTLKAATKAPVSRSLGFKNNLIYGIHLLERKKWVSDDSIAMSLVSGREGNRCQTPMPDQVLASFGTTSGK